MTSRRFFKSKSEAATERWYVRATWNSGDVTGVLDEELSTEPRLRRVSEWEFVTAPPQNESFMYVWRCRIVDDDNGEEREDKFRLQTLARELHKERVSFEDVAAQMQEKGYPSHRIEALRAAFLEVAQ